MLKHIESFQTAPNVLLTKADGYLNAAENLVSITIPSAQFATGFLLSDLKIDNCDELGTLSLAGSTGISVSTATTAKNIPDNWGNLTMLRTVSFANCGFSNNEVGQILKEWARVVDLGLGSSATAAKTFTINGSNGIPNLTDPEVAAAKTFLTSKGWTVAHR